jgi:integrase/recombinase XerD
VDVSPTAFKEYLVTVKAAGTARKYGFWAAHFLQTLQENGFETFQDMPPGMLTQYVTMLRNDGKAPATVQNAVYAIKKYLKWLKEQGVEVPDVVSPDLPRIEQTVKEALSSDDLLRYFRACDNLLDEPMRSAVMLLPCSGLRGEEMCQLRLMDIRRERVQLKDGSTKSTLVLRPWGKGDKQRVVPLLDEGTEILTGYLAGWRRGRKGGHVFPNPINRKGDRHVTTRAMRASIQKVREHLGQEWTAHTMRRTYLTILWKKGVDIGTIAKVAGHANVQTLIKHYLSLDSGDLVAAVHNRGGALVED